MGRNDEHVMDPNKEAWKGIFLKIGAFWGVPPILGPPGPKRGVPPKSAPIDH